MLEFADDTNVICPIENEEYGETLQADIDRLMDWSNKWKMQFNVEKCSDAFWLQQSMSRIHNGWRKVGRL